MDEMMTKDLEMMKGMMEESGDALMQEEDALFMEMAPKGVFSKGALNSLVKAHNKLTPLFGLEPYPTFTEDATSFPTKFVREIMMIAKAVEDAIGEDVLDPSMAISIEGIKSDRDIAALTARLDLVSRQKDFKKFLESPPPVEAPVKEEVTEEVKEGPMGEEEMDSLFEGRM